MPRPSNAPTPAFATFFPSAPSVIERKGSNPPHGQKRLRSPSREDVYLSHAPPKRHASSTRDSDGRHQGHGVRDGHDRAEQSTSRPEDNDTAHGDLLNGVGSASSTSTSSSLFSTNRGMAVKNGSANLTPMTNLESSPPHSSAASPIWKQSHGRPVSNRDILSQATRRSSTANTYGESSVEGGRCDPRNQERPYRKGAKVSYDPELDDTINSKEKKTRKIEEVPLRTIGGEEKPTDPRLASPSSRGPSTHRKTRSMVAPYVLKRYTHDANSVGSGAPKNIVVTRFDPLTPVNQIRNTFSAFGEIARISNETDPNTGSFLGVCLIKYADRKSNNGGSSVCAVDAAKKAYAECKRGQCRVGLHKVQAELDRDLSVGRRAIAKAIERQRPRGHRREKLEEAPSRNPALDMPGPPPTAPKGPSGRPSGRGAPPPPPPPPEGPRGKPAVPNLIEETPILDQIKRKPYVYLAGCYVKVSSATVPHLEKRLRSYDWEAVRLDMTGYYVVFADSRRGEEEAQRCHDECNMKLLFDCTMNLDCHRYGNPNYERSPSPERVKAEQRQKAHQEKLRKEREVELEDEMKQRALNMDPVKGMVETLQHQLTMKLVEDFKSRVVATALFDYLDPACHSEKRRQLNIADPLDTRKPGAHHHDISRTHVGTPDSRNEGLSVGQQQFNSKSYTKVLPRIRKGVAYKIENSAFADERRQQRRPRKAPMRSTLQMYHQAMQDDISDDDRRTTVTRDTEEPESRPISRMSLASVDSDDESDGDTSQQAQAIIKEPERDHLEQAQEIADEGLTATDIVRETTTETLLADLNKLPRTSKKRKRLQEEYTALKKQKEDEELFGPCRTEDSLVQPISTPDKDSSLTTVEVIASEDAPETPDQDTEVTTTKVKKPKAKKKTKKQIFEEREALKKEQARAQIEELYPQPPKVDEIKLESQVESEPAKAEELPVSEVDWSVSKDEPRRIVVDDPDVVMDLDGWQHLLKDEEDLRFLRLALTHRPAARINNSATWAWKQKQIKALNQNGERGVIRKAAAIEGYYVPNPSGCARTEGTGKILESEKSKYLPHRLKVMKAREERQAQAKSNPSVAAAEAAKVAAAKSTSKSTSRSNRANNRRLVADLTAQKQMLATANGDSSAIEIEWNQLQKRKKAVKFDRSAIHNWGLYAMEDIVQGEMIIEYVGEKVRQQVADRREINYVKSGIGSSYLFRIDDTFVIDATKRGGIARFINHSCMPNCTARIISVKKDKRIVIYALKDIGQNEELTYDYKFERDWGSDDRVPCLCGTVGCKGFLN